MDGHVQLSDGNILIACALPVVPITVKTPRDWLWLTLPSSMIALLLLLLGRNKYKNIVVRTLHVHMEYLVFFL